jgi:hypothetical protein
MISANPRNLDEHLATYAAGQVGLRLLAVGVIREIERLELTLAQQAMALEAVEQSLTDLELDTLDEIYRATAPNGKQKPISLFSNNHQRKYEQRQRLRRNHTYKALMDSRRDMRRKQARLTARLHKLEAFRTLLLTEVKTQGEG